MKFEVKNHTDKKLYINFDADAIEKLNLQANCKVNFIKDEHGYLSLYRIPDLSEENGLNVTALNKNTRVIYSSSIFDYFNTPGDYEIEGEPCWNSEKERLIYEVNEITN